MILADFIAAACRTSQHLLKQDTRFHATHKHQRGNLRHVDAGSQQIHRHHNAGEAFVLEALDFLLNLFLVTVGHAAGNLHNRVAVQIILGIKLLQYAHNHIGMRIGSSVNQRFAVGFRRVGIKIFGNLRQNSFVEFRHDNTAVELVDVKIDIIVQISRIKLAGLLVDIFNSIALFELNSLLAELRCQLMRCVMVNQITIQHSLAIGVGINRLAENFRCLQGRRCGERNFYRVKIIQHIAILALVIALVAIKLLCLRHFLIQNITTVSLVDNNQIVIADCGNAVLTFGVHNTLHHTLYGSNVHGGFRINQLIGKLLDIVNLVQRLQAFQLHLFKDILRLHAQSVAVNKE